MKLIIPLGNQIIILCAMSWMLAQAAKGVIQRIVDGYFSLERFLASGGMPSSHSALVTCCAVSTGMLYGFDSGLFAIATVLAIVVMYDACHVRRSSGEQAKLINEMLRSLQEIGPDMSVQEIKVVMGHTTLQVLFGAILGLAVGFFGVRLLG